MKTIEFLVSMGNDNIRIFVITMALFVILRDFQSAIE